MPVPGSQVGVAFKVQSAQGTAPSGSYIDIKHDEVDENPGYIVDEGRPEVGGNLYTISSLAKYGAAPFGAGRGKIRLETVGILLEMMGWVKTGTGPYVYTPAATIAAVPYVTADYKYVSGIQSKIVDCRGTALALSFVPRQAPTFQYSYLGGNHATSTVTHAAPSAETVPSPVDTILSANSTFFGTGGYKVYEANFLNQNGVDNTRQALGQITPDDIVTTALGNVMGVVLAMSANTYNRLTYGSTGGAALSATIETGAMNLRIANGAQYIEFDYPTAQYTLGQKRPTVALEQVTLPVVARCTGTPTITIALS